MKAIHNLPKMIHLIGLRCDRKLPQNGVIGNFLFRPGESGELTENQTSQADWYERNRLSGTALLLLSAACQ
jgi:hypothetical protein